MVENFSLKSVSKIPDLILRNNTDLIPPPPLAEHDVTTPQHTIAGVIVILAQ